MSEQEKFMKKAIELSVESVKNGGGPFGAVIVKDGEIISAMSNSVTQKKDPTAHAEVNASEKLESFDLSGCEIYSSCEPCPMCLGAIYWARLDKLYFANNKTDAKNIGFDDSFIYEEIATDYKDRKIETVQMMRNEALIAFKNWQNLDDKIEY